MINPINPPGRCTRCETIPPPRPFLREYIQSIMKAHTDLCSLGWQFDSQHGRIDDARFAASRHHMASLDFSYEVQSFYQYLCSLGSNPDIAGKSAEQLARDAEDFLNAGAGLKQRISTGAVISSMLIAGFCVVRQHGNSSCTFEPTDSRVEGSVQGSVRFAPWVPPPPPPKK